MSRNIDPFFNVILCEDIRSEIGNKRSLMGVFGGDVIVPKFPTQIPLAVYFQYTPEQEREKDKLSISLFQNETEITHLDIDVTPQTGVPRDIVTLATPRGTIGFDRETNLRVMVSLNDAKPIEILNKKVMKGPVQRG